MKTRSQKLISLLLVLVMLLTMVPAGIFSASAEDVVTIGSAADWAAAASTDLSGKTVKLTQDISGITAPLADTFNGTFDGQGYAIKDSTVAGNGVIANTLAGGATVQNVKFQNVDLTGTGNAGMIAGTFTAAGTGDATTLTKINVDANSSVTATAYAGGLLGEVTYVLEYTLSVSNVSIEASVKGTKSGGIIGLFNGNTKSGTTKSKFSVSNSLIAADINGTSGVEGALMGQYTGCDGTNASSITLTNTVLAPKNCSYALMSNTNTYYIVAENLYVTVATLLGTVVNYANYWNGTHVQRSTNGDAMETLGATGLPEMITAKQAAAAANLDAKGFITAIEVKPEALDLSDYENTNIFTIRSVDDWKVIATSGKTFAGKTVMLGADIDFKGAEALPLVPASLGATTMIFNGQNYAIKNATASAPLIAGSLTGSANSGTYNSGTEFSAATTVKNVTFEKITLTAAGDVALVAGTLTGDQKDFLFENIKVVDCDITSTAGTAAAIAAIQEYGASGSYNPSSVKANNVTIDANTTITASTFAAGVLAHASGTTNSYHVFSNIYVAATITTTSTPDKYWKNAVGGILGYAAGSSGRGVTLNFDNCVVAGSLYLSGATEANHGTVGGLFGMLMGGNAKVANVTIKNAALNLKEFTNVVTRVGGLGYVNNSEGFILVMDTVYTKSAPTYEFYDEYGKMYNGSVADENLVTGTKKNLETKQMFKVNFDDNGFVASIIEVDPATCEHEWSDWNIITPATGFAAGLKEKICSKCDYKVEEVIPELDFTAEELAAAYDTTSIFVIKSAAEWNVVATSGKTFAGKTIMLGADIDFKGAEALPLVPASLGATTMIFNGQNYAIKNATASAPLIAGILTATGTGANPGADASTTCEAELAQATTIKNVTFENITLMAEGDVALIAGTLTGNSMDYIFENIKVVNCDVTSTAGSAAALFVTHERGKDGSYNRSVVSIKNVVIDADTNITAYNHAAGLFVQATQGTNTALVFQNIYMAATVKSVFVYVDIDDRETEENESSTHETDDGRVGGLVALSEDPGSRTVHYYFKDVAVVGSLITEYGAVYDGTLGGLLGYAGGVATFKVENVVIDLKEFTNYQRYAYSLAMMQKAGAVVTYKNLYIGNAPKNEYMNGNGSSLFEAATEGDKFVKGGTNMNLPNVAPIDSDLYANIIVLDANGFVTKIKDTVRGAGYQVGNVTEDSYAIRFIGLSQLTDLTSANNVNMKIVATYAGGSKIFDTSSDKCVDALGNTAPGAVLYDALRIHTTYGVESKEASEFGAEKIIGFTIYNVPKMAITYTITVSYVNAYGIDVESAPITFSFDANAQLVK